MSPEARERKRIRERNRRKNSDGIKEKDGQLKRIFGITIDQYEEMLMRQCGVCAICSKEETSKHRSGNIKHLSVDHNHQTGKVRGLLCQNCNRALGLLGDDSGRLLSAAAYLERNK